MPLHNRYVVAAVDEQGEQLAFVTQSFGWVGVTALREAAIFQSQQDANYFIEKNKVLEIAVTSKGVPELGKVEKVRAVFVTVNGKDAYDFSHGPDGTEEVPTMTGIYG